MAWPYCQPSQFTLWVDVRVAQQLLSDTTENLPEGDVPNSPILLEVLKEGATELDQALSEHLRYDPRFLAVIAEVPGPDATTGVTPPDHGVWLRKMNAARAVVALQQRRVRPSPEGKALAAELVEWSERQLEMVHAGKNVIPAGSTLAAPSAADARAALAANQEAGLPDLATFDRDNSGGWLNPRGLGADTNPRRPDSLDTLNRGYRDG